MLATARRRYNLSVRFAFIETDHLNTPGSTDSDADLYFLPDASQKIELIAAGIDDKKLVVSGIPVRREMFRHTPGAEAKERLGFDPARKNILIGGGYMGCGPMPRLIELLRRKAGDAVQICALCAGNEHLRKRLYEKYSGCPDVHILGVVTDMSLLYDSADAFMTKPGGASTAEAAAKGLPMVLIDEIGGNETHNLVYYTQRGCALTGKTDEELCERCLELLEDTGLSEHLGKALKDVSHPDAAEIIYEIMAAFSVD